MLLVLRMSIAREPLLSQRAWADALRKTRPATLFWAPHTRKRCIQMLGLLLGPLQDGHPAQEAPNNG